MIEYLLLVFRVRIPASPSEKQLLNFAYPGQFLVYFFFKFGRLTICLDLGLWASENENDLTLQENLVVPADWMAVTFFEPCVGDDKNRICVIRKN